MPDSYEYIIEPMNYLNYLTLCFVDFGYTTSLFGVIDPTAVCTKIIICIIIIMHIMHNQSFFSISVYLIWTEYGENSVSVNISHFHKIILYIWWRWKNTKKNIKHYLHQMRKYVMLSILYGLIKHIYSFCLPQKSGVS